MPDYSKGTIYIISCNTDPSMTYVGSTVDLTNRKHKHKTACNNVDNIQYNYSLYTTIRANGGWDNWSMKPYKLHPCKSKVELIIEEERCIKELNPSLNKIKAYRSKEEYARYKQEWKENNRDKCNEKRECIHCKRLFNKSNLSRHLRICKEVK